MRRNHSDKVLQLRNDYMRGGISIAAPSLLEYEVLNALRYSGVYGLGELREIGVALNKYGFELYRLEGRVKELTLSIALERNITSI